MLTDLMIKAYSAKKDVQNLSEISKNNALRTIAKSLKDNSNEILLANEQDVSFARNHIVLL